MKNTLPKPEGIFLSDGLYKRHMQLAHPKYRADIDGLRAVAILAVVGFHAFPAVLKGGFVGVDIFFVISGFLISGIIFGNLENNSFSFAEFYRRRIRRIFPALIAVLIASLVWGWFVPLPSVYRQLGRHIAASAAFYSNFVLWHEAGYFDAAALNKPLRHIWSLAIEEQFYIIWPLLVWLIWKKRLGRLAVCLGIILASFYINARLVPNHQIAAFYSPLSRFWELTAGSLLAYLTLHPPAFYARLAERTVLPNANAKAIAGMLLIVSTVFYAIPQDQFPGWWALPPVAGAYLVISAGRDAWINRIVLSSRLLVWIGLISYPLYLWHWPLLSFAYIQEGPASSPLPVRAALVLASIALAWLTYRLVEKPIRFGPRGKEKTATLCALMVVIGYAGNYIDRHDGLEGRFPPIVQQILNFKFDHLTAWRVGTCFLEPESHPAFGDCTSHPVSAARHSVVLWGDSFAASLYPGFKKTIGDVDQLTQLSAKGCVPILDYQGKEPDPYCKNLNDYTFEYIKAEKTDRVVLAGSWEQYDWTQIDNTVKKLRQIGIKRIDLVGTFPDWKGILSQLLYNYYRSEQRIPYRMDYSFLNDHRDLDKTMAEYAKKAGINYISVLGIFCNDEGCLARVGDTGDTLTSWNNHHLTAAGSEYVVSRFPK